jgi:hypothetical protein
MSLEYTDIYKTLDTWASENSPLESNINVRACKMNSLIDHPYSNNDALGKYGIPAGLVLFKAPIHGLRSITTDMIKNGGGSIVPKVVDNSIFDQLFNAVSYTKKRNITRKKRI